MGVERAVTRWYVHRQMILHEIESLERRLQHLPPVGQAEQNELKQQLAAAREKLRGLGTCPKPMMG